MSDSTIDSAARFEGAFEDLLREAIDNDVDVRGSWVIEVDDNEHDFEALIVELDGDRDGVAAEHEGTTAEVDGTSPRSDGDTQSTRGPSEANGGEAIGDDRIGSDSASDGT